MKLTNRRKQYLEEVVQMHATTNKPIHYSDIAESIGVSKWTAYDVLKELEKHHFLKRNYTKNQNETGRSLVVYVPTEKSKKLFERNMYHITSEDMWDNIQQEVHQFINKTDVLDNPIEQILIKMTNVHLKIELCAYFIGVLIVYLNRQGNRIKELTVNLIHVSKSPQTQLSTFVGAVVGMIIASASDEISPDMVQIVEEFMTTLEDLNNDELNYLITFLHDAS